MDPPATGDDWVGLTATLLPVEQATAWVVRPDCGAVVVFVGTVRDHADGREDVVGLEYEAYAEQVGPRLAAVARDARARWPELGRVVLLHREGALAITDPAVVVAVSAPHRAEAFAAARFCIDTVKAVAPIWKREEWAGGERAEWGTGAVPVAEVGECS